MNYVGSRSQYLMVASLGVELFLFRFYTEYGTRGSPQWKDVNISATRCCCDYIVRDPVFGLLTFRGRVNA